MGVILATNFKIYKCTTWAEGGTHGGDIDTLNEIPASGDQVIFDDVTDAQRVSGVTEYRKIFFRNENDSSASLKCWIEANYQATNETIYIALGTNSGTQTSEATGLTYYQPTSIADANVLDLGALAQNAYKPIWIKRVVSAGGNGYSQDSFQLKIGMY